MERLKNESLQLWRWRWRGDDSEDKRFISSSSLSSSVGENGKKPHPDKTHQHNCMAHAISGQHFRRCMCECKMHTEKSWEYTVVACDNGLRLRHTNAIEMKNGRENGKSKREKKRINSAFHSPPMPSPTPLFAHSFILLFIHQIATPDRHLQPITRQKWFLFSYTHLHNLSLGSRVMCVCVDDNTIATKHQLLVYKLDSVAQRNAAIIKRI